MPTHKKRVIANAPIGRLEAAIHNPGSITAYPEVIPKKMRFCPYSRLERSRWRGGHCLGVEQPAVVAKVRLGHKEGGSCDPFTQEDAGRTPAAQLLRGHDASVSACSRAVRRTLWRMARQVRSG